MQVHAYARKGKQPDQTGEDKCKKPEKDIQVGQKRLIANGLQ